MKLTIKEQFIWLMMKGASYKLMWAYLSWQTTNKTLQDSLNISQCQDVLRKLTDFTSELRKKSIYFSDIRDKDMEFIKTWYKYTIIFGDNYYPSLWYFIPQPPIIVFYRGNIDLLKDPLISIIGTRKSSAYGNKVTELITQAILDESWKVVSGLALGIDQKSHETAVAYQNDSTIAIIASGHEHYYPKQNRRLEELMYDKHLVLSEFLPYTQPKKHHFIMRNRLVAGISKATIVIEAAHKSGSLITANYALQYNREVFALPGRIFDQESIGCNELIQLGAHPILSPHQLIYEIKEIFNRQGYSYK